MSIEREIIYRVQVPENLKILLFKAGEQTFNETTIKDLHRNILAFATEIGKAYGAYDPTTAPTEPKIRAPYGSKTEQQILSWIKVQPNAVTPQEVSVHFRKSLKTATLKLENLVSKRQLERIRTATVTRYAPMPSSIVVG